MMRSLDLRPVLRIPALLLALGSLSACVGIHKWQAGQIQKHREIELADVAKSWCQTIRASQVIPIYPLTEDLQPGDVFLVTRTIEDQADAYKQDGFLPLDYHLLRLDPEGYGEFYSNSVLANDEPPPKAGDGLQDPPRVPAHWMRPMGNLPKPGEAWQTAPRAAFPSYSFSTQAGAGFNLAVPVQGVPVGLALLGNQAASGTITISEALTIGIDMQSIWEQLQAETSPASASQAIDLGNYASTPDKAAYLRVVTRVYLAGAMDVSIASSSSAGAGVDAGAPRPVDLLTQGPPEQGQARAATAAEYAANLKGLNDMLAADPTNPGASLRITMAGGNTVGLRDTFDPPLVVGYLGFDCEILPGGVLGPPVPTLVSLTDAKLANELFASSRAALVYDSASLADGLRFLREAVDSPALPESLADSGRAVARALDDLAGSIDEDLVTYRRTIEGEGEVLLRATLEPQPSAPPYERFKAYRKSLEASLDALAAAEEAGEFRVQEGESPGAPIQADDSDAFAPFATDRKRIEDELARVSDLDEEAAAIRDLRRWLILFWSGDSE